jgi:predicted amidohydrolase
MKIFPEFYLGGFPPNMYLTPKAAYDKIREDYDDEIIIAGYSEINLLNFYSSALIIDGDNYYSTRKTEPWGRMEKKLYQSSSEIPKVYDLSIGKTLVLLCNDAFEVKFGKVTYSEELWGTSNIDLIVVVSHWENGIDEFLIKRGVKRLAKGTECNRWILCDTFNGFRDSGNIDFDYC